MYRYTVTWHREDDGTYSKMKVWYKDVYKIWNWETLETNVSQEEYFRRKLANKL